MLPSGGGKESLLDNHPCPEAIQAAVWFLEKGRTEMDAIIAEEYGIVPAITAAAGKVGISLDKEIRLACVDEDLSLIHIFAAHPYPSRTVPDGYFPR